jgi:altronate dehydratase
MKNNLTSVIALTLILVIGLGCGNLIPRELGEGSDKTETNRSSEDSNSKSQDNSATLDNTKTGVAECDEFLDLLNEDAKQPNEDVISRKVREYVIDIAKESIKKNIEENKGDKQKIAEGCRKAKEDYLRKKEEDKKSGN